MVSKLHPGLGLEFDDLEEELQDLETQEVREGEYTKEIHAERLNTIFPLLFAHESVPREICPAAFGFNAKEDPEDDWVNDPCFVCAEAVGVISMAYGSKYGLDKPKCPCHALGCEEALRRTRLFLEKMGYK